MRHHDYMEREAKLERDDMYSRHEYDGITDTPALRVFAYTSESRQRAEWGQMVRPHEVSTCTDCDGHATDGSERCNDCHGELGHG